MTEDRLITVAIHTYEHAVKLKNLLESEGVPVVLHNVNLSQPVVSSGVRVRIHEKDLPLALRIIENRDIFSPDKDTRSHNENRSIVVPIDFSDYSTKACDIAFHLAFKHKTSITLLHSYLDPYIASGNVQLTDSISYDVADAEMVNVLNKEANNRLERFSHELRQRIKTGQLPAVPFKTEVAEGVPEEVIVDYAKDHKPEMIVMGTRGAGKKEKELIGSVTAEVLDSCRFPVFTVPESVDLSTIDDIKHIILFSNLEQEDILALDAIYRFFSDEHIAVTIVNIPSKKNAMIDGADAKRLLSYCREHYPRFTFNIAAITLGNILDDFKAIEKEQHVDIIAVPNKKKNIFARLFNPSLAHKLLFHSDIPMVVIPV